MSYDVYEPAGGQQPRDDPEGEWLVMVEYSNRNGQAKPPTLVEFPVKGLTSREEADAAARKTAFEFDPPDPWSPQGRWVYKGVDGEYRTVIQGATTSFHFATRVMQYVGEGA